MPRTDSNSWRWPYVGSAERFDKLKAYRSESNVSCMKHVTGSKAEDSDAAETYDTSYRSPVKERKKV